MTSTDLESTEMASRTRVFGALSDPIRLAIIDALVDRPRCVCDLQELLSAAPNLLSYHLKVLREARLIDSARRGRWIDYRLATGAPELLRACLPDRLFTEVDA